MLELADLSGRVIGAAIDVHQQLGPGYVEAFYETALCIAMAKRGIRFQQQCVVPVRYEGIEVGRHRLDLLVEKVLVVELKAVSRFTQNHYATLNSYLRATGLTNALLLNFSEPKLVIKRWTTKPKGRNASPSADQR